MTDLSPFSRFQALVSEIFQFDTGDLDFGIYRILNAKRRQIEAFVENDLQAVVDGAFAQYAQTRTEVAAGDLDAERAKVIAVLGTAAFDAQGQLHLQFHETPLGKTYLTAQQAAASGAATETLKAKVYNDLLTFFARYYDEGDFLPLRRVGREMTYAIPYNGEEVTLYWANKGQYYIKTDDRLSAYRFRAGAFHVALEVRAAQTELNNNKGAKRFYLLAEGDAGQPAVRYEADAHTLHIYFVQRPLTEGEEQTFGKAPQEKLNKAASEAVLSQVPDVALRAALTAPAGPGDAAPALLLRHLTQFTKKNTADFFIHKNLSAFLTGELDQFIKTECLRLDELLGGAEGDFALQTARARATKQVGDTIIALLSSVEDFQKRLFEKRKFVLRTDYVFTLDRVPAALHASVLANAGQRQEWRDLYDVDGLLRAEGVLGAGAGLTPEALQSEPFCRLPVDTRHFEAAFTAALLGSVEDLDALTDGVLFNSENFQALNLMTETYRERVKCLHIDPPYNTETSGFLYKNDYKHSSWLSMMENRLAVSLGVLTNDASYICHIDENEYERLSALYDTLSLASAGTVIWDKRNPMNGGMGVAVQHEYIIWRTRQTEPIYLLNENAQAILNKAKEFIEKEGSVNECVRAEFSQWISGNAALSGGERAYRFIDNSGNVYQSVSLRAPEPRNDPKFHLPLIHPITGRPCPVPPNGFSRTPETLQEMMEQHKILFGVDETTQPRQKVDLKEDTKRQITSVLPDAMKGTAYTAPMGINFPYCHPCSLYETLIGAVTHSRNELVLDYFAGSGTTGHAVINLNRNDDGSRKYILCEMGTYFDSVLLPRLKKAAFASTWRDGKPTSRDAVSQTLKYHTLEQYEDTLNNLLLRPDAESQQALDVFGEDYLLRYLLDFDTAGSPALLNVDALADPLHYALRVRAGDDFAHQAVDLPETFSYLLGLRVRKIRAFTDGGRDYRAVWGDKDGQTVAHIWRKSSDLVNQPDALTRDKAFIDGTVLPALGAARPDRVFINGAFTVAGAENCEPELFRRMFAAVGA